jgi:hypothetical protein
MLRDEKPECQAESRVARASFPDIAPYHFPGHTLGHAMNDRRFWRMLTAAEQAAEKRSRQPIFFETRGVAAKLGVKLATVRRYITTGRLKAATRIAAPPCPLVP